MQRDFRHAMAWAAAALVLCNCGGGGSGANVTPAPAPSASAAAAGSVATIVIPKRAAGSSAVRRGRRRAWVSPSTQAIQIEAQRSDGVTLYSQQALTPSTSGCTTLQNGSLECLVPFQAPVTSGGTTDDFQVYLFDGTLIDDSDIVSYGNSSGNTVAGGAANDFSLVLGGVIGDITFPDSTSPTIVTSFPEDIDLPVTFYDPDGNTIEGPFDAPATVTITGAAAANFTVTQPVPQNGAATIANSATLPGGDVIVHYSGNGTVGTTATVVISSNSPLTSNDFGNQVSATATIKIEPD